MKNIAFLIVFTFSTMVLAQSQAPLNLAPPPSNKNGSNGPFIDNSGTTTSSNGSVITFGNGESEEAKTKRRKAKCMDFMKQHFAKRIDEKQYSNFCSDSFIAKIVSEEDFSVNSAEYLQCANTGLMAGIDTDVFMFDCSYSSKNSALRNAKFPECYQALTPDFGKAPAYKACLDSSFLYDFAKEDVKVCLNNMKYLKQTQEKSLSKCSSYMDRTRISSGRFVTCIKVLEPSRVNGNAVLDFCNNESNLTSVSAHNYPLCVKAVENAGVKVAQNQFGICANQDAQDQIVRYPGSIKCYLDSLYASYKNYFFFAALVNANGFSTDKSLYTFLNKDCKNESKYQSYPPNPYVTLVKEINIHTYEGMYREKDWVQTGGYSALSYDPKTENLYMLSDETFMATKLPPRMYVYQLNKELELKDKGIFMFTFNPPKGEQEPDIDPEGLARLANGDFIVSSEIGANEMKRFENRPMQITNLNVFDSEGNHKLAIPLPESYKAKYTKIQNGGGSFFSSGFPSSSFDSGPTKVSSGRGTGGGGRGNFGGNTGGNGGGDFGPGNFPSAPPPPPPAFTMQLSNGFEFNKGIESLSISPDEKFLFVANENALVQDQQVRGKCKSEKRKDENNSGENGRGGIDTGVTTYRGNGVSTNIIINPGSSNSYTVSNGPTCGKIVRIVRYNHDESNKVPFKYAAEYKYELEPDIHDGMSEILAISSTKLLTLERHWDSARQKVTARIYKVELKDESIIPAETKGYAAIEKIPALEKTLIIDFDTIVSKLAPGFHNIDNLEGMAWGPILKNGKRSLLMVTDNNFRLSQRTVFFVFEASDSLFE